MTRVSIVINNHNYATYLAEAIDSALGQAWPDAETIVVDDGSTDNSRDVIARYAGRVLPVLKANGGQASAFAAGLAASSGDIVLFLDSDDRLFPGAAATAVASFRRVPDAVKVTWPLLEIDAVGQPTGARIPTQQLPRGDLRQVVLEQGADSYLSAPTSGNAWSRGFLEAVLPAPEEDFRRGADGYLITIAPLYGLIERIEEPQGCYRAHGANGFWRGSLEERVTAALERHEVRARALRTVIRRLGIRHAPTLPNPYVDWLHGVQAAIAEVRAEVPAGEPFLLVDGGEWGDQLLADRQQIPFTEREGVYWGPPADDEAAAVELAKHARSGLRIVVVAPDARWWIDHYSSLGACLMPLHVTENVAVYRMRPIDGRVP